MFPISKLVRWCNLILVFTFAGCISNLNGFKLSVTDTLRLEQFHYPTGWNYGGVSKEEGWGTPNAFLTSFTRNLHNKQFVSNYYFLAYATRSDAEKAFDDYKDASFYVGVNSDIIWHQDSRIFVDVQNADEYMIQCAQIQGERKCVFWGHYGSCIILFQAPLDEGVLLDNEYTQILETHIDSQMLFVEDCYSATAE